MLLVLRLHDANHAQRARSRCARADAVRTEAVQAGHQNGRDYGHPHGYFVGNHLRAGAQRADQWVVRVRCPAGHHHSQHA